MDAVKIIENTQGILHVAEEYKAAIEAINKKRELWKATAHQIIKDTLSELERNIKVGWHVQDFSRGINLDTVNICFPLTNRECKMNCVS